MLVNSAWIDVFFEETWGHDQNEHDQLKNAYTAAARTMIGAVALQSKNPVRIAGFLDLPTPYVSAVLWNLGTC